MQGRTEVPIETATRLLCRKWKPLVVWTLRGGGLRFNRLQAALPGVSHKVLIEVLRELERDGLLRQEVAGGPRRQVSYQLSPAGAALIPALALLERWAEEYSPA